MQKVDAWRSGIAEGVNMLETLKTLFVGEEILEATFGIEREGLRVSEDGKLALSKHPEIFGDKLKNPYITTDFSESQVEIITPNFSSSKMTYDYLNTLYDIVALNIGEEYLWPGSMPCDIPEDDKIPIAEYRECGKCHEARRYREELLRKYGGQKQLISGIHYNFSFEEPFIEKLYKAQQEEPSYKLFKDALYLKIIRNYLKYRWLLIYLTGATPILHKSYAISCRRLLEKVDPQSYTNEGAVSFRNGEYGYRNKVELHPDYSSISAYIESINQFVAEGSIQSYKELYSQIRAKGKDNNNLLESLEQDGIRYIEVRSVDVNPFEKSGISVVDLQFLHLFMIYLLVKEESQPMTAKWQEEAINNQRQIAKNGLLEVWLSREGKEIKKTEWALEILEEMMEMTQTLGLGHEEMLAEMIQRVKQPECTYAARLTQLAKEKGYLQSYIELATEYKAVAYQNRYKLYGYEDMELSTQILMKEAITRGITTEVLDRSDNFIELKRGKHVEYVKQATKTSKDSYMTMLMMENKTVTKKILERHHICVPKGCEINKNDPSMTVIKRYVGLPIVVKPKSTNFGTGISIFTQGASLEDINKALAIGFEHDDTVLIERFAPGKEYRFLVIGDEVAGVLHRVPANVKGDGEKSIRELVAIKNLDSLRGKGYKTPLEKINLDASSALFLKQRDLDFDYIPAVGEVVYLRENSNISTGGDSIDYTDEMPQRFKDIAVESAKAVGAKFCGVDMMLEDYTDAEGGYAIIELNFNPAIHIHSYPYKGTERKIAEKVLRVLDFLGEEPCEE